MTSHCFLVVPVVPLVLGRSRCAWPLRLFCELFLSCFFVCSGCFRMCQVVVFHFVQVCLGCFENVAVVSCVWLFRLFFVFGWFGLFNVLMVV